MVVRHLIIGTVLGMLAMVLGLLMGYSFLAAFGFYLVGGLAGILMSVATLFLNRPSEGAEAAPHSLDSSFNHRRQADIPEASRDDRPTPRAGSI